MIRALALGLFALDGANALAVGSTMPKSVLSKCGISGKKAVVFFYGADDAPSCSKEISAFDAAAPTFKEAGVTVVGVRNEAGVKSTDASVKLVVDEADAMRTELAIEKDLFFLGGRETYVVDASGKIVAVHNNQFDPNSHVSTALDALSELPKSPFDELAAQVEGALASFKLG